MGWGILLCFYVLCNGQAFAVDVDFEGVGVAAFEVDFIDGRRD